jgi:hypothetical protein
MCSHARLGQCDFELGISTHHLLSPYQHTSAPFTFVSYVTLHGQVTTFILTHRSKGVRTSFWIRFGSRSLEASISEGAPFEYSGRHVLAYQFHFKDFKGYQVMLGWQAS